MSDLETLAREADTPTLIAAVRTRLNARSLVEDTEVPLPALAVQRLLTLASEAQPRPQIGVRGYVRAVGIDDASGEYLAHVAFADQDTARRAGELIFADVMLEPVFEMPAAANQERTDAAAE